MTKANALRGEVALEIGGEPHVLRPSFAALVAAEGDLGPLMALVDRAAEGRITLDEITTLFWHCLIDREGLARDDVGAALLYTGLAQAMPLLRSILRQILTGAQ